MVPPVDPKRSGFVLSNRYGSNSATASNVCFNTKTSELILYRGSGGNILNKRDKMLVVMSLIINSMECQLFKFSQTVNKLNSSRSFK